MAVCRRRGGASGTPAAVRTVAACDQSDAPTRLSARSRKWYVAAGASPVAVKASAAPS